MALAPTARQTSTQGSEIPDKLYFRIGEVARLCDVPAYVLRFWEGEFSQLHPNKGGTGQRLYRRRDVEMALRVKRLLYDEGYTIAGAKLVLKAEPKQPAQASFLKDEKSVSAAHLRRMRKELEEISVLLSRPVPGNASGSAKRTPGPRLERASKQQEKNTKPDDGPLGLF